MLALAPLSLSAQQPRPAGNFRRKHSSELGMVGFAMLLAKSLLLGRFRQVLGHVGIELTMHFHQLATLTALAFIVAHPFVAPRLEMVRMRLSPRCSVCSRRRGCAPGSSPGGC